MVKERKCKTLDEWFNVHGRPNANYGGEGFATEFKQNPRVHAGTKYLEGKVQRFHEMVSILFRAIASDARLSTGFRSNATIMKPGRLTK
jgi:hypothetical protein